MNGYIIFDNDWRVCAGVPIVGSGLVISPGPGLQPAHKPYTYKLWRSAR